MQLTTTQSELDQAGQVPAAYLEGWRCRYCCCECLAAARAYAVVVDGQLLQAAALGDGLQANKKGL
jgi:hypothetical protein